VSEFLKAVVLIAVLISIPLHALVLAYFLNRRWYRQKRRALIGWLDQRGWIEAEDWERRRKRF